MCKTRWKCRYCGSDFREPEPWYAGSSIGHAPDGLVCPYCKGERIEEAERCFVCKRAMFDDELTYGICESCIEDYASDYASDYVTSDPDVWDAFAYYMSKRMRGQEAIS